MKLHSDTGAADRQRITAYGVEFVTVEETTFTGAVLLGRGTHATDFDERRLGDVSAATIERILERNPEVVLLGTGARHMFPSPGLLAPLTRAGIGVEAMSTSAACRTWNILNAEGRKVVALLLPIEQEEC
ncbi:MAG: MTH938/NDUFAF3 family protein [Thiotrichales bacterium]|nr:MTH938/NDUFAF3 family protein [Thiotrichales bacterium]MCY4349278.1 MTH938/NDUFAF3 family protein [Thiotrichales bacterium]